jgi:cell division protein FtsZ
MLFLAAGMGGGTGTGATPVIAKLAKELGILTVGVVTKPFHFEQKRRLELADDGLAELDRYCDTLIVISNQKLFGVANEDTTFADAFKMADNVLVSGVKCITNLITNPGIVNLDFADVKSVMSSLGRAIMGEGEASGENRAIRAAEEAITNPLLEHSSIVGASSILINITSGPDITLFEVNDIMQRITKELGNGAISKFGSVIDQTIEGVIRVSIVATGIKTDLTSQPIEHESPPPKPAPKKYEPEAKPQANDFRREYPQNVRVMQSEKLQKEERINDEIPNNTIRFPMNKVEEEVIEDEIVFEDLENGNVNIENGTFFIPPAARRVSHIKNSKELNYKANNGLFSKIFNKKD